MEENKNLVISYRYYYDGKCSPEDAAEKNRTSEKINELFSKVPTDEVANELCTLVGRGYKRSQNRRITVRKEYPVFLVKDFKTKEELYDFIDEDEPNISMELEIFFESVPDCLKEIGFTGTYDECRECVRYIERKHGYDYGEDD